MFKSKERKHIERLLFEIQKDSFLEGLSSDEDWKWQTDDCLKAELFMDGILVGRIERETKGIVESVDVWNGYVLVGSIEVKLPNVFENEEDASSLVLCVCQRLLTNPMD